MRHRILAALLLAALTLLPCAAPSAAGSSVKRAFETASMEWLEGAYFNSGALVVDEGFGVRKLYGKIGIIPLFKRDKHEFALDLTLRFDERNAVRKGDWDDASDWARKILFYRVNTPEDIYSFAVEPVDGMTFGGGSILRDWANSIRYPLEDRKLAAVAKWNSGYDDMAILFLDDVTDPRMFGARGFLQPHDNLILGATAVTDRSIPTRFGPRDVTVAGIDVQVPFRSRSNVDFKVYGELNRMADLGDGSHAGIEVDLGDVTWRTEYRRFADDYMPNYFDHLYDMERTWKATNLYSLPPGGARRTGWFNEMRASVNRHVTARASYQKDDAPRRFPHLSLGLECRDVFTPNLTLSFDYDRKNAYHSPSRESGPIWQFKTAYSVDARTHLVYDFKHLLDERGNPANSIHLETRIRF